MRSLHAACKRMNKHVGKINTCQLSKEDLREKPLLLVSTFHAPRHAALDNTVFLFKNSVDRKLVRDVLNSR